MKTYKARNGKEVGFEKSPKWIRVRFGNQFIADSKDVKIFLPGKIPVYYFPKKNVKMELLEEGGKKGESELLGSATFYNIKAGGRLVENAAWNYPEPASDNLDMSNYIAFEWNKMDSWFEEAEEVFVHPHDPYHRIDTIHSTRNIRIELKNKTIAESNSSVLLFETGLPTRYYIPRLDVNLNYLEPTSLKTGCAYKGFASYYSVRVKDKLFENICWHYDYPTNPMAKIATMIAFFNEKVDLYVDGDLQERPKTMWS